MSDQDLFGGSLAEKLKARAGRPYRPSNGTEGEMFMDRFCYRCRRDSEDSPCGIIGLAMAFEEDEPGYPAEWVYTDRGQPTCTAYDPPEGGRP